MCSDCGGIISVRLALWNHTKQQKGFGYIEFEKETGADNAARKTGLKVGNRMVIVDYETNDQPKNSFKKSDGQHWAKIEEGKKALANKMKNKR